MRTIKLMAIALSQPEMLQVSPSSLQNGSRGDLIEFDDTVWGISHLFHDGGIGNGDRGDSGHSDAGEGVSDG
jgi:hypothetical protein